MRTKVKFTGKKLGDKVYYKHTGYAGGIKEVTAQKVLEGRFPERVLEKAVERMIPRGPLGRQQMRNLRIFAGAEHPHEAQNPEVIDSLQDEPQEQGGCIMSDTVNSLSDLQGLIRRCGHCGFRRRACRHPSAPLRQQEARQAGPRLCHRPPQGRRRPRVDQARHRQDHGQWPRSGSLFRASHAAPRHQPAVPVADREGQYDVICTVKGGGLSGQAGAVKHGIAQALSKYEPALRGASRRPAS
jgi:hypothetical protein